MTIELAIRMNELGLWLYHEIVIMSKHDKVNGFSLGTPAYCWRWMVIDQYAVLGQSTMYEI